MVIKKIVSLSLCFSLIFSNIAFAGGVILKGQTFVAKENVRYFTEPETKKLLDDLKLSDTLKKEIELLKSQIELYKDNELIYKRQIDTFRESNAERKLASENYKESLMLFKESAELLKSANGEYHSIIKLQNESIQLYMRQANNNRRMNSFERGFVFISGLLSPVLGAGALGYIGKSLNLIK